MRPSGGAKGADSAGRIDALRKRLAASVLHVGAVAWRLTASVLGTVGIRRLMPPLLVVLVLAVIYTAASDREAAMLFGSGVDGGPASLVVPCEKFRDIWTPTLEREMKALLGALHGRFTVANLDYALAYGTALGYSRNGGFIPWDDDIDVIVQKANAARSRALFDDGDEYPELCTADFPDHFKGGFKIFRCDSPRVGSLLLNVYEFFVGRSRTLARYPFIDVFASIASYK